MPGDPLETTLAELVRSQRPQRTIFLRGLTQSCVRHFTHQFTSIQPSDELVEALYQRTEGNPLFLIELLEWLSTRDERFDEHTSLDVRDARIPEGVRHVIGRRLDALSPECQRVMQHAAVVGRDFSLPVVAPICGLSEDEVLEHLELAERRRIVEPVRDGSGRFWFTHALIAETLRDQLGTAARAKAHRRTAEILERLYAMHPESTDQVSSTIPGPQLAELAHHFGEAAITGDPGKAVDYATRAGDYALEVLAFEEAASAYERVLGLVESGAAVASTTRAEILASLAAAHHGSGDLKAAQQSLKLALASARSAGDPVITARLEQLAQSIEMPGS
jgi:predicted ATPase